MKSILVFILVVLFVTPSRSQEITRNNVYLEIGGASLFYSINYERLMFKSAENNMAVRLGVMYLYSFDERERQIRGVPLSFSYLKRIKKNYFEIGLSGSAIYDTYNILNQSGEITDYAEELIIMPSIRAGIRHQPSANGFYWNALLQYSLTAVGKPGGDFNPSTNSFPFISIGLGYSFK
jgi:hypothetical protein